MLQRKLTHFMNLTAKTQESGIKTPRADEKVNPVPESKTSLQIDRQRTLKSGISPRSSPSRKENKHKTFAESKQELLKLDHADLVAKVLEKAQIDEWAPLKAAPELMLKAVEIVNNCVACEDLFSNKHVFCKIVSLFRHSLRCPLKSCVGKPYISFSSKRFLIKCVVCSKLNPCKFLPQIPWEVIELFIYRMSKEQLIQLFVNSGLLDGCRWKSPGKIADEAALEDFMFEDSLLPPNSLASRLSNSTEKPSKSGECNEWIVSLPRRTAKDSRILVRETKTSPLQVVPDENNELYNNPFAVLADPKFVATKTIVNGMAERASATQKVNEYATAEPQDNSNTIGELLLQIEVLKEEAKIRNREIDLLREEVFKLSMAGRKEESMRKEMILTRESLNTQTTEVKAASRGKKAPKQKCKATKSIHIAPKKSHGGFVSLYLTGVARTPVKDVVEVLKDAGVNTNLALDVSFIGGQVMEIVTLADYEAEMKELLKAAKRHKKLRNTELIRFNPLEEQPFKANRRGVVLETPLQAFKRRLEFRISSIKKRLGAKPSLQKLLSFTEESLKALLCSPTQQWQLEPGKNG